MKHFRNNTWDRSIADCVIRHKEYGNIDFTGKVVVDVGCHIGSFSFLAAKSGASRVSAFEAFPENYELAVANIRELNMPHEQCRITVTRRAVWRSDVPKSQLNFAKCHEPINTGGGTVFGDRNGIPVDTISLDEIITDLGHIDILKLDCEGSEFPILLTSQKLENVDLIVGEYHEMGYAIPEIAIVPGYDEYLRETLGDFLSSRGFSVTLTKSSESLGKFVARRNA